MGAVILASCAAGPTPRPTSAQDSSDSHFAFQVVYSEVELDAVEVEDDFGNSGDLGFDRERIEARFGFGPERMRGKFSVFGESVNFSSGSISFTEVDAFGIGGGMSGTPRVGGTDDQDPATVDLILPYEWDLSAAYGDDQFSIGYAELRASLGFGIEWMGLQPSAGIAASGLYGIVEDDFGNGLQNELDINGFNAGVFGQVRYSPPSVPLLMHVRFSVGNIETLEFGFGIQV